MITLIPPTSDHGTMYCFSLSLIKATRLRVDWPKSPPSGERGEHRSAQVLHRGGLSAKDSLDRIQSESSGLLLSQRQRFKLEHWQLRAPERQLAGRGRGRRRRLRVISQESVSL